MRRKMLAVLLLILLAGSGWNCWLQRPVGEVTGRVVAEDGMFGTISAIRTVELPGGHGFSIAVRRPCVTLLLEDGSEVEVRTSLEESRSCYRKGGHLVTVRERPSWECLWCSYW